MRLFLLGDIYYKVSNLVSSLTITFLFFFPLMCQLRWNSQSCLSPLITNNFLFEHPLAFHLCFPFSSSFFPYSLNSNNYSVPAVWLCVHPFFSRIFLYQLILIFFSRYHGNGGYYRIYASPCKWKKITGQFYPQDQCVGFMIIQFWYIMHPLFLPLMLECYNFSNTFCRNNTTNCTLWETYAAQFIKFN